MAELRLATDSINFGPAAAGGGTVTVQAFSPTVDLVMSEMPFAAWDANYQPFTDENKSSGNTPAAAAIPSLFALTMEITEDGDKVPFQKPIRVALLASGGKGQRVFETPIRFYKGRKYDITIKNEGAVAMLAAQWLLTYGLNK